MDRNDQSLLAAVPNLRREEMNRESLLHGNHNALVLRQGRGAAVSSF